MKKTVVLYPGLAVSHFIPMMKLADVLLEHGYAVDVALINPAVKGDDPAFTAVVDRVVSSKPSVSFHTLPLIRRPPSLAYDSRFFINYSDLVRRYNEHLHDFLCSVQRVHALVIDASCVLAIDVAKELGVPAYDFYPSNAGSLAVCLQLPALGAELKELGEDTTVEFLGVPPMPTSHVQSGMVGQQLSEEDKAGMMDGMRKMTEFDGILINTVVSLEERAVRALGDPRCGLPDGRVLPPVYCVGPLVEKAAAAAESSRHECVVWLDGQPDRSVVFLCFGSVGAGSHSEQQLKEIALGLDKSGHRFLWVVRAPGPDLLDALLPEGFLERTNGRGLVVTSWAPQVDVLRHRATGAFVTHCGWNSVLEGVTAGVPMLCWPLYAEQRINKVLVVEEMRVGVEVEGWHQGLVTAEEVEAKVRLVMESKQGRELRARVEAHMESAAVAWKDGGSSRAAFVRLLSDLEGTRTVV